MELTAAQGRVLGALVEKERTTPQGYPLTDNALLAACNQTTSRDPVVQYDVATVRMAVRELREQGLLRTVHRSGERSDKHRHELEAALDLSGPQVCLLAVLLLRGPQTLAELRARSERMHAFGSVDEVERELAVLADRDEPLVGLLPRQPGRKEARFGQLLVERGPAGQAVERPGPEDGQPERPQPERPGAERALAERPGPERALAERRAPHSSAPDDPAPERSAADGRDADPDGPGPAGLAAVVAELVDEVAALRREVDDLRDELHRATGG